MNFKRKLENLENHKIPIGNHNKVMKILEFQFENQENYENDRFPNENDGNHENHIIPFENHNKS